MTTGHTTKQTPTPFRLDILRTLPIAYREIKDSSAINQIAAMSRFGWVTYDRSQGTDKMRVLRTEIGDKVLAENG